MVSVCASRGGLASLAWLCLSCAAWAQLDEFNYDDGGNFVDEGWDDGDSGKVLPKAGASPFTPGVQNDFENFDLGSPFNPGNQNQGTTWNNGQQFWNQGNQWNNGQQNNVNPNWNGNSDWMSRQNAWNNYYGQQTVPQTRLPRPPDPQFMTPQVSYSNQPIKLAMPEGEVGPCGYLLISGEQTWNYTMFPGKSQTFNEDRDWKIVYDRGEGFGEQAYQLKTGLYRFRRGDRGWELYRSDLPDAAPVASAPPPPM